MWLNNVQIQGLESPSEQTKEKEEKFQILRAGQERAKYSDWKKFQICVKYKINEDWREDPTFLGTVDFLQWRRQESISSVVESVESREISSSNF